MAEKIPKNCIFLNTLLQRPPGPGEELSQTVFEHGSILGGDSQIQASQTVSFQLLDFSVKFSDQIYVWVITSFSNKEVLLHRFGPIWEPGCSEPLKVILVRPIGLTRDKRCARLSREYSTEQCMAEFGYSKLKIPK